MTSLLSEAPPHGAWVEWMDYPDCCLWAPSGTRGSTHAFCGPMVTLHVGTYAGSGGPGLVPVTLGRAGILTVGEAFPEAASASFGVHSARHGLTYVADEQDDGSITVLRRENGTFSRVARLDSGGAAPCYLALDGDETQLAVANYESGNVAVFELDSGGLPGPRSMFQSSGS